jgi:DNA topoisomerase-1
MLVENGHDPAEHANLRETAAAAGLHYVSDDRPGLRRRRTGKHFSYRREDHDGTAGEILREPETLARIRSLAIPPAWTDVWICADPRGHLQATGRDARGRKQYRYHPAFRAIRESTKYEHLLGFAQALPRIRAGVAAHMALRGLPREKVLATIVNLLETTLIRVGNSDYARDNKSYGLTTLNNPHIQVKGAELRFHFKGKSGKIWRLQVRDRRIAKIVKACQELPGQQLFQYVDDAGEPRGVTSSDVNDYLRQLCDLDITAKDFRTWAGTVQAALALTELGAGANATQAKRNLKLAIERVAARLGNTITICRKCYIHPQIIECYLGGALVLDAGRTPAAAEPALTAEEAAVYVLLRGPVNAIERPAA